MSRFIISLACVSGLVCVSSVQAASLQVSPVSLDLTAPSRTSSITLRNEGENKTNVQIRVYKWTQVAGVDQLSQSTDVIISPPAATLQPNNAYTIRVVKMKASSQDKEESYRLLIDELPEVNVRRRKTAIDFATRYSIPVFFSDQSASADLHWKVQRSGKNLVVEVSNTGNRHAKLVDLTTTNATGNRVNFGAGLNGYVLPGSTMRWTAPAGSIQAGSHVNITAKGDDYDVNQATVVSGR